MNINRRKLGNLIGFGTLAFAMGAGITACGKGNGRNDPRVIHFGNVGEPKSLDPYMAQGTWENQIISDMFEGLMRYAPDGKAIPGMATSWTISPDGLVWTFKLRDAKWSDNTPVTAEDFVYGWQRLFTMKPPSQYASLLFLVKNSKELYEGKAPKESLGIKAIDPKTVEITLLHPAPYLLTLMAHYVSFPMPKHIVEKYNNDWIKPEHVVVNGAFKLVQWSPNDFIHVEKNPNYYDASEVCLNGVYYYPTQDDIAAERRVRTGKLDVQANFSGSRLEEIERTMPGYAHIHDYIGITYCLFNIQRKTFKDVKVREALSLAIDREFITNEILKGGQKPAYSLVPPGIENYNSGKVKQDFDTIPRSERLVKAKKLLEEAGYGPNNPLNFTYDFRNSGDNPRVAPVIQQNWRDIAPWIQVQIAGSDVQIAYEKYRTGDFDVADAGWVADFNDARNFLYNYETSAMEMNYGKYSNPVYDNLVKQADHEKDAEKRRLLMEKAEKVVLDDYALAPVYFATNRNLVNPRITGWVDNSNDYHRVRYLCTKEAQAQK